MPNHSHLARLDRVWTDQPIVFITTCAHNRRAVLNNAPMHGICREVWRNVESLYGWIIGRYVLMPDHCHFFCSPRSEAQPLQVLIGKWKEWTAKYARRRHAVSMPLWQEEFFDHVLRSQDSYEEKWNYVRANPVRARLVRMVDDWPYQGELHPLRYE
ncbi:MAG: transposase [Pirellulales bacterium]